MAAAAQPAKRVLLGTRTALGRRQRVYRFPDGLEVEDSETFTVTLRRVFFDEVLLVTYHSYIGWPFVLVLAGLAAWFGFVALAVGAGNGWAAGLVAFVLGPLPLLAAAVLRLVLKVDAITVYGKRTRASLHFWLRKQRGRELYQLICRLAQERQEQAARERAATSS